MAAEGEPCSRSGNTTLSVKAGSVTHFTNSVGSRTRVNGVKEQCIRASFVVGLEDMVREKVLEDIFPPQFLLVARLAPLSTVSPSYGGLRVDEGGSAIVLSGVILEPGLAKVGPLERKSISFHSSAKDFDIPGSIRSESDRFRSGTQEWSAGPDPWFHSNSRYPQRNVCR